MAALHLFKFQITPVPMSSIGEGTEREAIDETLRINQRACALAFLYNTLDTTQPRTLPAYRSAPRHPTPLNNSFDSFHEIVSNVGGMPGTAERIHLPYVELHRCRRDNIWQTRSHHQ